MSPKEWRRFSKNGGPTGATVSALALG
jgi:hypothetical protein